MATNLLLDDKLINAAAKVWKHKTKRETVNAAIAEYVRHQKRLLILESEGTVDFRPDWDHKADRRRGLKRIPTDTDQ